MDGTGHSPQEVLPESDLTPSLDELYRHHAAAMHRVAVAVVRDQSLAEDVVQESLIKAWRAIDDFRGESSLKTWLLRITHNTAVSLLRKLRDVSMDPTSMPETPTESIGQQRLDDKAFMDDFQRALFELDDLSRSIITLREIEEMSYERIAVVVGVSEAVVKTRLYRGRRQLQASLSDWANV
ncbi:MAG: RNA polymerase sigma factor [Acidimicrobiia bacterium]|nr:RNA polymerase sigma factor [Acidimicrobiia bacterium]